MPIPELTSEPAEVVKGTAYRWRRAFALVEAGETVRYEFTHADGGTETIGATDNGDGTFTLDLPAAFSLSAGSVGFQVLANAGGDDYLAGSGRLEVLPAAGSAGAATNATTHAQRMLAAIEATLEGRATSDQQAYTIQGRSLDRIPFDELRDARNRYRAEVARELGRVNRTIKAVL